MQAGHAKMRPQWTNWIDATHAKKIRNERGKVELVLAWVVARNRMCLSYLMLYKFLWKFPCLLRCLSMWSTTSITCTMCTMCTLCMWCMVPWRNAAFSTDEKFLPYLDLLKFRNVGKRLESKPNPVNSMILWSLRSRLNGLNVFKSVQSRLPPRRMEHRASAWDVRVSEFCDEGDAVCGDATFATFYAQTCHSATGALFWATTCDLLPGQSTIAGLRHGLMPTGAAVKRRCSGRNRNARNGRNGRNGDRATCRRGFKLWAVLTADIYIYA